MDVEKNRFDLFTFIIVRFNGLILNAFLFWLKNLQLKLANVPKLGLELHALFKRRPKFALKYITK